MASALLIDKGFTSKTHNGVICLLGQEFATKGVGPVSYTHLIGTLGVHAAYVDYRACWFPHYRRPAAGVNFKFNLLPEEDVYKRQG